MFSSQKMQLCKFLGGEISTYVLEDMAIVKQPFYSNDKSFAQNSSIIRQKGESQNGCFFPKNEHLLPPDTRIAEFAARFLKCGTILQHCKVKA